MLPGLSTLNIFLILILLAVAAGGGLLLMSALNGLPMIDKLYNNAPDFRPAKR